MRRWRRKARSRSGIVLVEILVSLAISIVILGIVTYSSIGITSSLSSTERYVVGVTNENRLMDYVAADLRRALRVSILSGSTTTTIKDTGSTTYSISESTNLLVSIPDYYASNTPDNTKASSFKSARYSRATLNTSSTYNGNSNSLLNGVVPWAQAQTTVGGKAVTLFAPSSVGNGELVVRYYRAARSANDPTLCYFRSEYPSGTLTPSLTVEIAERISDSLSTTTLLVSARNAGQIFRLQSSFTPAYRRSNETSASTNGVLEVSTRNPRRD